MRDSKHIGGKNRNELIAANGFVVIVAVLAFAAWLATGDQLLMSLIQTGLSWCF